MSDPEVTANPPGDVSGCWSVTGITTTDGSDNTWTDTCSDTGVLAPPSETATFIDTGAVVEDATATASSTEIF